jgi:hypothetical protein
MRRALANNSRHFLVNLEDAVCNLKPFELESVECFESLLRQ